MHKHFYCLTTIPMKKKKASDGIQYRQMPLFLRFPQYSVFALCIN